jgi:hypothetical protein
MAFRKILKPNKRKIMTVSAMKPVMYPITPLKVTIIIARAAPPSTTPIIVTG